jgi:hypothetical protein
VNDKEDRTELENSNQYFLAREPLITLNYQVNE